MQEVMQYMKIMFASLGCDKNLVDTENMLGILNDKGFEFTDDETQADVIVVNTCCFIGDAKQESINTILEMAQHKEDAVCKALIVTGCLAHRYKDEIIKEIPEVDAFARDVAYTYTKPLEKYKNPRGGMFQAGLYPVSANVPLGGQTCPQTGIRGNFTGKRCGCERTDSSCKLRFQTGSLYCFEWNTVQSEVSSVCTEWKRRT